MFGLHIKVVCPNCQKNIIQSLGCSTVYYKINRSKFDYTKCKCYLCNNNYWLSHTMNAARDVKKVENNEELEKTTIVCW